MSLSPRSKLATNRHRMPRRIVELAPEAVVSKIAHLLGETGAVTKLSLLPHAASTSYSGGIINAPAGTPIQLICGSWRVPTLNRPASGGQPPYSASQWIGIDGFLPTAGGLLVPLPPLLQVGVTSEIDVDDQGVATQTNHAFREYVYLGQNAPTTEQDDPNLWNFDVTEGDLVHAVLWVIDNGTAGAYWMYNDRTGLGIEGEVRGPAEDLALTGSTASWITEAESNAAIAGAGTPRTLADFREVDFSDCGAFVRNISLNTQATLVDFGYKYVGLPAIVCDMIEPLIIAHADFTGDESVSCYYGP